MNSKYYIDNSNIHGKGAFASKNYAIGDNVGKLHKIVKLGEEYRWTELGRMYNHSEEPNTKNVLEGDTRYMVALRPIRMGEELTSDYRLQPDMEQPEQWTGSKESESDFGDIPKAQFGGWVKGIKNLFTKGGKNAPQIIKNTIKTNNKQSVRQGLDLNTSLPNKQLTYEQKKFYRGHKDPNLNLKDIKSHPTGTTNFQFENISPITGKPNLNIPKPDNALWFTPQKGVAKNLHEYTSQATLNIKNPFYMTTRTGNREWSFAEMQKLIDDGYDAIIMNTKKPNPQNWWNATEIIPLDKNIIKGIENIKRMGGSIKGELMKFKRRGEFIDGKFVEYEYDDKGYRTQQWGQNKEKWEKTQGWGETENYERNGNNYSRRVLDISRKDLEYLKYKKKFLKDTDTSQNFNYLVDNSKGNFRLVEITKPNGKKSYQLQHRSNSGYRTFSRGNEDSGLANLTPEYIDDLKSKGWSGISQFSSWFDLTPKERKEYGREEWINTPFQMDLRIDKDGKTWSGWDVYGTKSKSPLQYTLRDEELRMLPATLKKKYDLIGKDHLRMDPFNGEIYIVNDRGSHKATISQKDMKWFQNPGRLKEAYNDPKFNFKEDNMLDYLNNYDFRYWTDTQPIELEAQTIDQIPTTSQNIEIKKPDNTAQSKVSPNLEDDVSIETNMPEIVVTPQMEEARNKKSEPKEFANVRGSTKYVNKSADAILDSINKSDYTEQNLNRDLDMFKKYYGEDNLALLKDRMSEIPKAQRGAEIRNMEEKDKKEPGWLAKRLRESVTPIGYNLAHATKEIIAGKKLPFDWDGEPQTWETFGQNLGMSSELSENIKNTSQDLWDKYLGFKPENKTIKESKFIPTKGSGTGEYYSFNNNEEIWHDIIQQYGSKVFKAFNPQDENNVMWVKDSSAAGFGLKNYKLEKGFDKERNLPYISYYDEFDFDIPIAGFTQKIKGEKIVGNPFELYGRLYYDEKPDSNGNIIPINEEDIDDYHTDREALKAGIIHVESYDGKYMSNAESTSTGLYGQLFSEVENNEKYDGNRDDFKVDVKAQDNIFNQRYDGTLFENQKGLQESADDLYIEYKNQIPDFPYDKTEVAALVNFLGRQGTREFLSKVVRDGKDIEEVFPNLYSEDANQQNKTPDEYIEQFREGVKQYKKYATFEEYVLKVLPQNISEQLLIDYDEEEIENKEFSKGGELRGKFYRKWDTLMNQLEKYENGGKISGVVKDELMLYDLIDKPKRKFSTGGPTGQPVTDGSDWRGVPQSQMTDVQYERMLKDMKEGKGRGWKEKKEEPVVIPQSIDNYEPEDIKEEEEEIIINKKKPKPKPKPKPKVNNVNVSNNYDNLSFGPAFDKFRSELGPNRIFTWRGNKYQTNRSGEPWNPSEAELELNGLNNKTTHTNIQTEKKLVNSIHSTKVAPDLENATNTWKNVKNVKSNNDDINKLQNIDKIHYYHNQDLSENELYETINYTVKDGDDLSYIAKDNLISMGKLMQDNGLNNNTIQPGQTLIIKKPKLKPYIVIDKKAGKTYVYYPGDSQPYDSYNTLLGKNIGDEQTVTKAIDQNNDGVINDKDKVNGKFIFDPKSGNRKTGAGIFTISNINSDSQFWDETGQNRPTPSFNLTNDNQPDGKEIGTTIHGIKTDNESGQQRKDALYSSTPGDNRTTYGCANLGCSDLIDMSNIVETGTKVYILPDNPKNYFNYQDGQIVFKANEEAPTNEKGQFINPQTGEVSNVGWYQDERGTWQKGQGINRTKNTINYNPIRISIDKDKIQETALDYNSTPDQENIEFNKNTKPYLNALVENKSKILKALSSEGINSGIPSDVYDRIVQLSFGIYGVESGMGNENTEALNLILGSTKSLGWQKTNPDVQRKYDGYGFWGIDRIGDMKLDAKDPSNSVGWTQIRWGKIIKKGEKYKDSDGNWQVAEKDMGTHALTPKEMKLLNKLGIKDQHDLMDPANAAIATQAILSMRYNTRLSHLSEDEKNSDMIYDELAKTWNTNSGYSKRVSNYFQLIDVYTANMDDIDENQIVEKTPTNIPFIEGAQGESTVQMTPDIIYLDIMGNEVPADSLKVMFSKNVNTGKIRKHTPTSNVIVEGNYKNEEEEEKSWWDPSWISDWIYDSVMKKVTGGELDSDTQKQIYTDYINGNFDNTSQEVKVKKLIDKMNRVYYNTSKSLGGHVYDYIRKL
jgi:LysM repeat protein